MATDNICPRTFWITILLSFDLISKLSTFDFFAFDYTLSSPILRFPSPLVEREDKKVRGLAFIDEIRSGPEGVTGDEGEGALFTKIWEGYLNVTL